MKDEIFIDNDYILCYNIVIMIPIGIIIYVVTCVAILTRCKCDEGDEHSYRDPETGEKLIDIEDQ